MLRHTIRAIPWFAPAVASVLSVLVVVVGPGRVASLPLQLSAILLAGSAAFALDDPAFEVIGASPTALSTRRVARLLVVIPTLGVVWGLLLGWRPPADAEEVWTLALMFAGLLGLSAGLSGVAGRGNGGRGAAVAVPSLLLALVVSSVVPPQWRPLPLGDVPGGWVALQFRWSAAGLAGLLLLSLSSRDPGGRRLRRRPAGRAEHL